MAEADLDRRQLRSAFARAAARYDQAARLQRDIADQLLERLEAMRIAPRRVLDLGCGTGYVGAGLARRYPQAGRIGLDIAEAMARHAARHTQPPLARLRARLGLGAPAAFVCADAEALPLASASVDLVLSNLTLQWCAPAAVFAEVLRVLRPGGLFLFTTFGPDTLAELRAAWRAADDGVHVHEFIDMHHLGDALVGLGYSDPVLDVERLRLDYPDVLALLRDLKTLGAHNVAHARRRGLTGKAQFARFRAAYQELAGNGPIPASYEVVFGQAWAPEQPRFAPGAGITVVPVASLRRSRS